MPFDTLVHAEATQNSGYAGVAGKGPAPIQYTGDTNILRKGFGMPIIVGLGSTSISKPQGCRISGNRSYGTNYIMGPGGLNFGQSMGTFMTDLAFPFQEGETITGQGSDTNVNEAIIVAYDVAYGSAHPYPHTAWEAMRAAGGGELWCVPCSATAASAVTPAYIGQLDTLTTDTGDQWLDTRAKYHALGTVASIGLAGGGGILTLTGLAGPWAGFVPGVPMSGIQATFQTQGNSFCYEPLPFDGDALPGYMHCELTAGAQLFGLLMAKHK